MGHGRFRPDVFTLTNQSDGELVLLVEAPRGYDEPQTLSYAINSICPGGPDGGQFIAKLGAHFPSCVGLSGGFLIASVFYGRCVGWARARRCATADDINSNTLRNA